MQFLFQLPNLPETAPVSQWSGYAEQNIDKLMRKFRGENFQFQDFT